MLIENYFCNAGVHSVRAVVGRITLIFMNYDRQ